MMKRLFAFATTKLVDATCYAAAKTHNRTDDAPQPRTDGGDAIVADADETAPDAPDATENPDAETDAEALLYADDEEFEAAFDDEWPSLPGESLTWLVEEGDSETLLIGYDRDSDSDDEFLQAPARSGSVGGAHSADE